MPTPQTLPSKENLMTEPATPATTQMQSLVLDSFQRLEADGTLAAIVDKQVQETMKRVVSDSLSAYSPFGKALEERIKEQAQVDFSSLDLPSYTNLMLQIIEKQYRDGAMESGLEKVATRVRELFGTEKPAKVKLSDFLKLMRDEHHGEEWEEHKMTLHVDDRNTILFISMDAEEGVESYKCEYKLTVYRDKETKVCTIHGVEVKSGQSKVGSGLCLGTSRRNLEALLVNSFMRGCVIEIDADEDHESLYFGND